MYMINQTNSLYFHPHKLHFEPLPDAADNQQRNRWFPGYDASVVSPRAKAPARRSEIVPKVDLLESHKDCQDIDADRMDDDGAPYLNAGLINR
ncbi:hypothetical protein [Dyella terrae]|uniref:hypothetical protein n=1 Tax=Dyella terrae TaxID=522259 RepID=UPI0018EBA43D|nr:MULTISPECIES: hypothetical protein [Dyella]ULU23387.1 hypothetical protein DYST_00283 [Dyella terrae]